MIVSNKKYVDTVGAFLMFLIPLILMAIIFQFMIVKKIDLSIMIFSVLLITILLIMFDLRYMEIENSGLVITFKKKHPITAKEPVFPILEFSVDLLEDFQVREYTIYFDVCSIRGSAGQIRRLKIELKGFSGHQLDEIIKSLVDRKQ